MNFLKFTNALALWFLLSSFANIYVSASSFVTGVELDVNKKSNGTGYNYSKDDTAKTCTFETKPSYGFSKVKAGSTEVWKASNEKEYATKVIRDGTGTLGSIKNITINLANGNAKKFEKKNNSWTEVNSGQQENGTQSNSQHSTNNNESQSQHLSQSPSQQSQNLSSGSSPVIQAGSSDPDESSDTSGCSDPASPSTFNQPDSGSDSKSTDNQSSTENLQENSESDSQSSDQVGSQSGKQNEDAKPNGTGQAQQEDESKENQSSSESQSNKSDQTSTQTPRTPANSGQGTTPESQQTSNGDGSKLFMSGFSYGTGTTKIWKSGEAFNRTRLNSGSTTQTSLNS